MQQTIKQRLVAELNRCMKDENHTAYTLAKLCDKNQKPVSPRSINQYRSEEAFSLDQVENLFGQMGYAVKLVIEKENGERDE